MLRLIKYKDLVKNQNSGDLIRDNDGNILSGSLVKVTSKDDTNIKIENGKVLLKDNNTFTEVKGIENPKYVRYESLYGSCNKVYFVLTNDNILYWNKW